MSVLGTLPLRLPTLGLPLRLHRVDPDAPELEISALDTGATHDRRGVLIPNGTEQVETHGRKAKLVTEALQTKSAALGALVIEAPQLLSIEGLSGLLLEDENGKTVVRRALVRESREPGYSELLRGLDPAKGDGARVRRERHIDGHEVAPLSEAVGVEVGDVSIDNDNGDEALALVEDLHAQARRELADEAVDEGADGDLDTAEEELDVGDGVEFGEEVGDDVELREALEDDFAVVGAPFLVGEVAVDGFVHVA